MADIMVTLQKLANENTAKTFKFNREEATKTRNWETQMSNTAHQREVKDLIAAGLNPVLSSGGSGASTPTTSSASGVADSAVNAIGNVQSSRNSASAMRYSARMNLQAAQAAAAAQRYAADQAYNASKYTADTSYKGKVDTDMLGWIKSGLRDAGFDPNKLIANKKNLSFDTINKSMPVKTIYQNLNSSQRKEFKSFLKQNGYTDSPENVGWIVKAIINKNFDMLKNLHRSIFSAKFHTYLRKY